MDSLGLPALHIVANLCLLHYTITLPQKRDCRCWTETKRLISSLELIFEMYSLHPTQLHRKVLISYMKYTTSIYSYLILPVKCMQYFLCFARISQDSKVWRVLCWVLSGVWYANRILLCEATVQHTDLSHGQILNGKAREMDNMCCKSLLALAKYQRIQASLMIAPFRKGYFLKWHIETYQVPPKSPKKSRNIGWNSMKTGHRNRILERHIEIETYQNHSKCQQKIGLEM